MDEVQFVYAVLVGLEGLNGTVGLLLRFIVSEQTRFLQKGEK